MLKIFLKEIAKLKWKAHLEMPAARSSGLTPPGPWENGVGAGVAGMPVLPPLDIPSSTYTLYRLSRCQERHHEKPAARSSSQTSPFAGEWNGCRCGRHVLLPLLNIPSSTQYIHDTYIIILCTFSRWIPAANCSARTELCWAGEGEKGVGMGVHGLLPICQSQ